MVLNKVRVWDLPTRVFHWGLVLCFIGLVATGEFGGDAMVWHFRFGYTVLSLLLFRLIWGFIGGLWSRFASFVHGPATILRYLRGEGAIRDSVGHNPLGALSVLALLAFALLQVAAGLFSDDEIATAGPLAKMVSGAIVSIATTYHTTVGKIILILLVAMHIAAIVFYRVRHKDNLVIPMLNGDKNMVEPIESARDDSMSRAIALVVFAICVACVTGFVKWAG
jgi:cytochrome b